MPVYTKQHKKQSEKRRDLDVGFNDLPIYIYIYIYIYMNMFRNRGVASLNHQEQ